jgi:hypothetical protein
MPRNALHGPGSWNVDLSFSRSFVLLAERASLQFRIELLNAFNHTNLSNPNAQLESPSLPTSFPFGQAFFGQTSGVQGASPSVSPLGDQPRRVQLALKVYF